LHHSEFSRTNTWVARNAAKCCKIPKLISLKIHGHDTTMHTKLHIDGAIDVDTATDVVAGSHPLDAIATL